MYFKYYNNYDFSNLTLFDFRSPAETMAFLKTKRIPRLQKSSDNQDDKQVAKKHKGESFDSCK